MSIDTDKLEKSIFGKAFKVVRVDPQNSVRVFKNLKNLRERDMKIPILPDLTRTEIYQKYGSRIEESQ